MRMMTGAHQEWLSVPRKATTLAPSTGAYPTKARRSHPTSLIRLYSWKPAPAPLHLQQDNHSASHARASRLDTAA